MSENGQIGQISIKIKFIRLKIRPINVSWDRTASHVVHSICLALEPAILHSG